MKTEITILFPVYDEVAYLEEAIASIKAQSFQDYLVLVINDGCHAEVGRILQAWSSVDSRVRVINNASHLGLTKSLNEALRQVETRYVARMDADDVSHTDRLEKQYRFMEEHSDCVLCGTQGWVINSAGQKIKEKNFPCDYKTIKGKLLFNNQFIHSSWFARTAAVTSVGGYNESYPQSQDYELILRLAARYQVCNLPERLISWRMREDSVSWSSKGQEWHAIRARWRAVREYRYPVGVGLWHIMLRLLWLILPRWLKVKRYAY